MINIKSIVSQNFKNKNCLLRLDLNIPLSEKGEILDDTRIIESIPSIDFLLDQSAKVIIISHIGRPLGKFNEKFSFIKLIKIIEEKIKRRIIFIRYEDQKNIKKIINNYPYGTLFMLDNLRFNPGEEQSNKDFINFLSSFSDIYINDGFGTIHRNHASITGISKQIPSYGGILVEKEITNIIECLNYNSDKSIAILGGSKIKDKIPIIENLSKSFKDIIITGGMIRPFLIASKKIIQKDESIYKEEIEFAKILLKLNNKIYIPEHLICSKSIKSEAVFLHSTQITDEDNIYDIAPNSMNEITKKVLNSDKIIWNGPPGIYEYEKFQNGTKILIQSIINSDSKIKLAGGGSTVAAINYFKASDFFTHISTGGGAFLSLLEGKYMEGIEVLKNE
ncbi:MAG: phosphoglycerate kinase [Dehalococcoidales bacterium]|jgi:3-phosphoglycerate kinase|nr:phosphoglycerate kinase [Dehalococcoidales bacterium]